MKRFNIVSIYSTTVLEGIKGVDVKDNHRALHIGKDYSYLIAEDYKTARKILLSTNIQKLTNKLNV